ncbi:MAG: DUF4263 domain-containing protein [Anaerolineales bacterium]|nr:DUF4263 domain-containing protein [Anaerolineales bacterium]
MARAFMQHDPERDGTLELDAYRRDCVRVYFIPPKHSLLEAGLDQSKARTYKTKLLDFNGSDDTLAIFPLSTFGSSGDFLQPKYSQIERITLEGFGKPVPSTFEDVRSVLERLPSPFVKDFSYGLGLQKSHRFIIDAVKTLSDCTEIVISKKHPTGPASNNKIFHIAKKDLEAARKSLNNIDGLARAAASSVKHTTAHNILAERIGVPPIDPKTGRHPFRKLFTTIAQGKSELSEQDQNAVLDALRDNTRKLAEEQPEKLAKLQSDIELVTLERLIEHYEKMLGKKLAEDRWQEFFNENPFLLTLAFGYPVTIVQDQASVGGKKFSGAGEKITDFLLKNSLTFNCALFEIKTPQTKVLSKKEYRGGVFGPSAELSASISQALDQKYQFDGDFAIRKHKSRLADVESYSVHCCLVIGKTPDGPDQQKSFELFRKNSKDVEIVTFDELLEKLKHLRDFLAADGPAGNPT